MHVSTLVAGVVIVGVAFAVLYFSAAYSNILLCLAMPDSSSERVFATYTVCNPVSFAPHILSFSVGTWLIIFGFLSRSARPILADMRFIYVVLAAGVAIWASILSLFLISAFDNTVSFGPPSPLLSPFTLNPLAVAALGAGLVLLALAGYVVKKSTSPAKILMWVAAFPAVALAAGRLGGESWWIVLGAVAAVIAAIVILRKKSIPSVVVAAVIVISVAGIVLSYQNEELEGYYPELTPEVFFVTTPAGEDMTIEGIRLAVVSNSSRILGPECAADAECVMNYSEGLAELLLLEGADGQKHIISATLSNNGVNPINVTQLQLTGLIAADTGKPQYIEVEAVRDVIIASIVSSMLGPRQDLSAGSVPGPVTIQPGESLSAYIKGQWVPYSEGENGPFPFQAYVRYEYELESLVQPITQTIDCAGDCVTYRANIRMESWDLSAGTNYREITSLPVNILSLTAYSTEAATRLSYAGCMNTNDVLDLYSRRNITLGFPDYLPSAYTLVCITERGDDLIQIYANASAPMIRDYASDDLRLISRDLGSKSGILAVTMRLAFEPDQFIKRAASEAEEIKTRDEFSSIENAYISNVQGGTIFVKAFGDLNASVDLNLTDRQYHIFGRGISEHELVRVAESIYRE
jgi:hypothetical protein